MGANMNKKKAFMQKIFWADIKSQVEKVNPTFAKLIDERSPGQDFYFYKATYPYGAPVLNKAVLMIPNQTGEVVPITDASIASTIKEDLGYNLNSNPVSMILSNSFEIFLPLENSTIPLNGVMRPGRLFGAYRILNKNSYQPKFIWEMTAGARSIFMLPKISEENRHYKLQKAFDIGETPKKLMDQWEIFRSLANHPDFPQDWSAEILFFPKQWFDYLDDPDWMPFYYSFYRRMWEATEFGRNTPIWNLIFSIILQEFQGKASSYISETVKYLMYIATGAQPGFAPVTDNIAAPIRGIQQVYYDIYGLTKYPLIIMTPAFFNLDDPQSLPIYYSLQFPTATEFGKSTRMRNSFVDDLQEIKSLLVRCGKEILSDRFNVDNTPLQKAFQIIEFCCFHSIKELRSHMKNSLEIMQSDVRFSNNLEGGKFPDFLSQKIPFMSGGIRISHKNFSKNVE